MPIAKPGLASAMIIAFIFSWNNLIFGLVLAGGETRPITMGILQAMTFDVLQQIAWLQSEDGMKGRNRPTPLPRPGAKAEETRTGTTALDLDEMAALLAARNPNQLPLLMTPGGGA